jgi:CheY-like chemotaxis protein
MLKAEGRRTTERAGAMAPRRRVLVVDDNENVLSILNDFLEVGYMVDTATNASTALTAAAANRPDMILLDVNMPGMDGLALCAALRGRGVNIPIVMMTGYDSPGIADKAKECGATHYLVKPVDLRRLDHLIAGELNVSPIIR